MKARSASFMFAAACAAAAAAAQALPLGENSSVELFVGGNAAMPGSFRSQTVPLQGADPLGQIVYDNLKFSDAYNNRYTAGGEFDYAFNSRFTAFGRGAYSQFDGTTHEVGLFFPSDAGVQKVDARFGDATTREFDLGARYSFETGGKVRPFVGAALGATRLSSTHASIDNVAEGGMTSVELGRASTVFQQRVETGLQFSPLANLDLRLTAAASHLDAGKRSDDPNLASVGLDSAHTDVRGHWDYPAELGAVWHF
jgi:Outer membrane protein beta-barrel domain